MAILVFSAFYTPWRLKRLGILKTSLKLSFIILILLVGFTASLLSRLYITSFIGGIIYDVLGLFLIFQGYLFILLLVFHLFHRPLSRAIKAKTLGLLAIVIPAALVIWGFINAQSFVVTEQEIEVKGLKSPVTIMHIPDMHLGAQRSSGYLNKVLSAVESASPDIVIYNGDLADSNIALTDEVFSLFEKIKAEQYYTTGNHEYYIDTDRILDLAKKHGLKLLRSEMVLTHGLQLIGLEYMNADRESSDAHRVNDLYMNEILPKILRDPSIPTILAHHSPVGLKYVTREKIEVMLTGHTHAGQLFPGTFMIRLLFPYYKGRYQLDDTTLLVSQGAGTFGPWMRLNTFNEVQLIKLKG
jgi:predicted MPP superfamily phosphohydrolase